MKHTRVSLFYVAAAIMAVYARCAQILYLTEEKSGFFKSESHTLAVALTVFIVLAALCSAAVAFFDLRQPKREENPSALLSIAGIPLALSFLYEVLFMEYVTDSVIFVTLTNIFAVLSAVSFCIMPLKKVFHDYKKIFSLLYIFPLLFFLFKLICVFTVYSTVSVIASNVFYLAFLSSALLFFLYVAKLENGIPLKSALLLPVGIICSMFALCCFVPQVIAFGMSAENLVHDNPHGLALCGATAIYSIVYTFSLYKK
ncbi:MAG: hypothetical protein IIW16_04500 [Clostridia bacterium]|nr:hypothetical protein [Clostridia bacterium]MBQ2274401.1 hypothetical protein [Clostridia bacterium]MBQ5799059.1 hypothetical protein [Clostridia bacterium]MEE1278538.1 hypothetical protein [Acutalibacteraceae bacterium]